MYHVFLGCPMLLHYSPTALLILFNSLLQVIATTVVYVNDESKFYNTINHLRLHLKSFKGISRRFEMIGRIHGCHIYDDYAHHPTEVRAVLQAARQRFPFEELVAVFRPHTYRYSLS